MSNKPAEVVVILGTIERETDKAILFNVEREDGSNEDIWFPKSQVEVGLAGKERGKDQLIVQRWLAVKRELV